MSVNNDREIERKYLIRRPSEEQLDAIPGCSRTEIIQTYLTATESGAVRRVRKRGSQLSGYEYTYTEKIDVAFGERIERERVISEEEYLGLLAEASPDRAPIEKTRCVFEYKGQVFELDIYPFSDEYAALEIELCDINEQVILPDHLMVLKDVTGDDRYANYALAASGRFPAEDLTD